MSEPLIECPKCKSSNLIISEAAEVHYSTMYRNGQFVSQTMEHASHTIRQFAKCQNPECLHEWVFRENVDLNAIPSSTPKENVIEYVCINCNKPRKIRLAITSIFDPQKDVCHECKIGITSRG